MRISDWSSDVCSSDLPAAHRCRRARAARPVRGGAVTPQLLLPIFVDCPYGGCEDGYCACLEQDLDDDFDPEDFDDDLVDDPYPEGEFIFAERRVETVPISIDDYEPPEES